MRSESSAGSSSAAPSATSRGGSTTSFGDARGVRATPASRAFFLSAEDDLIRLFAGERIYKILDRLGPIDEEGNEEALEAKMLTKTIEGAQKKLSSSRTS